MLGSLVIGNDITVTTDLETFIHKGNGHKLLFAKLSEEVHNIMAMLPSEEASASDHRSISH